MKIVDKRPEAMVELSKIKPGSPFDYDGDIYITTYNATGYKIPEFNADSDYLVIHATTGAICLFDCSLLVTPINASIVAE